jgi:predicted lysophospholipase L1 biosynthesis ABC-type transport system permease subunit
MSRKKCRELTQQESESREARISQQSHRASITVRGSLSETCDIIGVNEIYPLRGRRILPKPRGH